MFHRLRARLFLQYKMNPANAPIMTTAAMMPIISPVFDLDPEASEPLAELAPEPVGLDELLVIEVCLPVVMVMVVMMVGLGIKVVIHACVLRL